MVTVTSLWLPILLSAVFVFVASSVMHMMLKYHHAGIKQVPNEDQVMGILRGAAPGLYVFPYAPSMKDMGTPAMVEKFTRGPVGLLTVIKTGLPNMGKLLSLWFLFSLLVGVFVAYVCSRTIAAGADYMGVFRIAGTIAFLGYAGPEMSKSIWGGQPWRATFINYVDGLIYGVLTAGVFGWLWPR